MDLEDKVKGEAELITLGEAWMSRTKGVVIDGEDGKALVTIDRDDYIALLKGIPLWDEVKGDITKYTNLFGFNIISGGGVNQGRLLEQFPLLIHVLQSFLDKPLYSLGQGREKLSDPLSLVFVLRNYKVGTNSVASKQGDGYEIYNGIRRGIFDQEFLLDQVGMKKEWQEYQKTSELPENIRVLVRETLESFLENPHYSLGNRTGALSSPLSLRKVLQSFCAKTNSLTKRSGDCREVYRHLIEGDFDEDFVLDQVGKKEIWNVYQKEKKFPEEIKQLVRVTLKSFFNNPKYSSGNGPQGNLSTALGLRSILCSYNVKLESMTKQEGDCKKVYKCLIMGNFDEKFVLEQVGMEDEWEEYQKTRALPEEIRMLVGKTLEAFLENPLYKSGQGGQGNLAGPYTLRTILRTFCADKNKLIERGGDCERFYERIRKEFDEDFILEQVNMVDDWEVYQQSRGMPPKSKDLLKNCLKRFLQNPRYSIGGRGGCVEDPLNLKYVLRNYQSELDIVILQQGNCKHLYDALLKGIIEDDFLLGQCGLTQAWQDYQKTTASKPFVYDAKKYEKTAS